MRIVVCFVATLGLVISAAQAKVDHVDILSRSPVLDGKPFGSVGSFEKIAGRVYFKVKPDDSHNRVIVDLDKAATDADGDVEFSADFFVLRPIELKNGNGAVLLEIPNRGAKNILGLVNFATASPDPSKESDFGNGWLMREGYTVAWLGWQWDVAATPGMMRLYAPIAHEPGGKPIRGLLRDDFTPNEKTYDQPLGHVILGQIGGTEYNVRDPGDVQNVLTVRDTPTSQRRPIPRSEWSFAREDKNTRDGTTRGKVIPDNGYVHLNTGFESGKIYELVYAVQDPVVAGLGLAAVRDFVSYLKNEKNELATVARAYAWGASQSGRFLRHFLYQNFNADERGRKVLDGVMAHVAGAGRGSFNHRFAQPSRSAGSPDAFFFPADMFPFTDLPERDPLTGETAGLLDQARAAGVVPKIFYSNTSYEYWSRSASLIHTSPDGTTDAKIADDTRVYTFTGLQHFSGSFPPVHGTGDMKGRNLTNPNPIWFAFRAMIANMNFWVRDGVEPPASSYPRISDATLVPLSRVTFPKIPGVDFPINLWTAPRMDYGPEWKRGIITLQPPIVGEAFTILLPQVNADGNELGGVRIPELVVPLATCTGWNLRDPAIGLKDELASFVGSYVPFPWTSATGQKAGDPRPSVEERYATEEDFGRRFRNAAEQAVKDRWLLERDLGSAVNYGKTEWKAVNGLARSN